MIFPMSSNLKLDTSSEKLVALSDEKPLGNVCPIGSIFFSEFHNTAGPRLTYEANAALNGYTQSSVFYISSSYGLSDCFPYLGNFSYLQHPISAWTTGPYKVVGYPVQIDSSKYTRNALIFNLCFVFKSQENIRPYEPIVKKLGEYLRTVEMETSYLSNPQSKASLPILMNKLLSELNNLGRCSIEINKSNTLFLKVVPPEQNCGTVVHDYDVPVLTANPSSLGALKADLTTRQIIPLMDGNRNIHQISEAVDADGDLVKSCMQNLMFYDIAKVVPAFSSSNIHRDVPNIRRLITDPVLQKECMEFVAKDKNDPPSIRDIMILFGDMQHGVTVHNLITRHSTVMQKINEKKLCDFGLMNGLIRRVYKYPIYLRYNHVTARSATVMKWFNGQTHTDEIKAKHILAPYDLDDKIEADHFICVCWK